MKRTFLAGGLAMLLSAGLACAEGSAEESKAYDLLFKDGTLDAVGADTTILYRRDVINSLKPEAAERDTGQVALSRSAEDSRIARLDFRQEDRHRGLGEFPASVGNPMIMYFYESVVRDMAEAAGGSPFYIRNRVKDALANPGQIEKGQAAFDGRTIDTQTVRLYPFRDDPNRARMQGFGDLELRVTMSGAVPGWYVSLVADAPGPDGAPPVYHSELHYEGLETGDSQ